MTDEEDISRTIATNFGLASPAQGYPRYDQVEWKGEDGTVYVAPNYFRCPEKAWELILHIPGNRFRQYVQAHTDCGKIDHEVDTTTLLEFVYKLAQAGVPSRHEA